MVKDTNLIVGIDPGGTKAYAILDFNGDIIKLNSAKYISAEKIIQEIIKFGKVVMVSTDVNPVPKTVKKIATATGAKIIAPEKSLDTKKKRRLTSYYSRRLIDEDLDKHKLDALAAAYYAFKRIRKTLDKIKITLNEKNKSHLEGDVISLVLSENVNIDKALKKFC